MISFWPLFISDVFAPVNGEGIIMLGDDGHIVVFLAGFAVVARMFSFTAESFVAQPLKAQPIEFFVNQYHFTSG